MAAVLLPAIIILSLTSAYVKNHILRFALLAAADSSCALILALNAAPQAAILFFIISAFILNIMIMTITPDEKPGFLLSDLPAAVFGALSIAAVSAAAASIKTAAVNGPVSNPAVIFILFCLLFTAGYFIMTESSDVEND
jgi:hypothetical protein